MGAVGLFHSCSLKTTILATVRTAQRGGRASGPTQCSGSPMVCGLRSFSLLVKSWVYARKPLAISFYQRWESGGQGLLTTCHGFGGGICSHSFQHNAVTLLWSLARVCMGCAEELPDGDV